MKTGIEKQKGSITVFLSLLSILFLSLLCTTIESVRIQGCRAKAATALDLGMFSVMGQFERELLDRYDVFFLDGASGGSTYSTEQITSELSDFMKYNVYPNQGRLLKGFDPFSISMEQADITGVLLATDEGGAPFYQQAVGFLKENLPTELLSTLLERGKEAERLEEAAELYKKRNETIEQELKELKKQPKEEAQEQETAAGIKNPLKMIREMKRQGLMKLILGDQEHSQRKISLMLPSKRHCKKGTLSVDKKQGGLISDLVFQVYLFDRFSCFSDKEKEGILDYELEYILCGKNSDEENLKKVVKRLLLLREGVNFLFLASDPISTEQAHALATLLVGAIPIPGLSNVTAYALLLAWAYGESLLDLRELFAGGNVPIWKNKETWKLELNSLSNLMEFLNNTKGTSKEGLSYKEYLQILYSLGNRKKYPIRALDLIEGYMRSRSATSNFRADHAVCKIQAEAGFYIPGLFLKIPAIFLKTGELKQEYLAKGSFAY